MGFHHGYLDKENDSNVVREINTARPHVLFVAMGNPIQEKWIHSHLNDLEVPLCLGVGGLFKFWSGDIVRAPQWVRRLGLEWVHRLLNEPTTKWRRYILGNPAFLFRVARDRRRDRRRGATLREHV